MPKTNQTEPDNRFKQFQTYNPYEVFQTTVEQCHKQWALFSMKNQKQLVWFKNLDITTVSSLPNQWMTQYISNPIFQHFKTNAPSYLEMIKAQHREGDGWTLWAKKGIYNKSIDLVSGYAPYAISPIQTFLGDIKKKIGKETFDSLNPATLIYLWSHYPLAQQYFAQRYDQITTPIQYYRDFRGTFNKQMFSAKGGYLNLLEHFGRLEGGPMAKTKQFGRVILDMTEQTIAAKLGVAICIFTLFQVPTFKRKTNASFEYLFPKNTLRGFGGRLFPVKLMFSKPLAKVHGNPFLSFTVVTFMMAMSVAKSIKDSLEFEERFPDQHKRLKSYNREVVNSSLHLKYIDTVEQEKKNKL